jgi:hypothetical protein
MENKSEMKTQIEARKDNFDLLKATNIQNPTDENKRLLRKHFAENPKVWQEIADLAGKVQNHILMNFFDSFLTREGHRHKLAAMRDDLGWNTASELEKILIEQVCINWLRVNMMESVHFSKMNQSHNNRNRALLG